MCTRNCIDIPTYKRIDIFTYSCIDKDTYLLVYMGTGLQNIINILSLTVLDLDWTMLALVAAYAIPEELLYHLPDGEILLLGDGLDLVYKLTAADNGEVSPACIWCRLLAH